MWYVIQTESKKELRIAEICRAALVKDEEEVFVPLRELEKKFKEGRVIERSIIFNGYVFFETKDVESLYFRLKKIKEMTNILKTGDEFMPLYESEERLLKRLGGPAHCIELSDAYMEGEEVKVFTGPLSSFEGTIKKINRHKSIAVIELELLGQKRELIVGLRLLEKKPEAAITVK